MTQRMTDTDRNGQEHDLASGITSGAFGFALMCLGNFDTALDCYYCRLNHISSHLNFRNPQYRTFAVHLRIGTQGS